MPRIRSIHPGQWTDADFLECTPMARLLCIALRNVADDRGIFRWKPKSIKLQCLPGDNCEIEELLAELVENDQIERYEMAGKSYGLISNFMKWQSPRTPKYVFPTTKVLRQKHGLDEQKCDEIGFPEDEIGQNTPIREDALSQNAEIDEAKDTPLSQNVENRFEREGGRGGERKDIDVVVGSADFAVQCMDFVGLDILRRSQQSYHVGKWQEAVAAAGLTDQLIVDTLERVMGQRGGEPPNTMKYFNQPIADAIAEALAPMPEGKPNGKSTRKSLARKILEAPIADLRGPMDAEAPAGMDAQISDGSGGIASLTDKSDDEGPINW